MAADDLPKTIRSLILPAQRRLHRKDESDRRKHAIASAIIATDIQVTIYDAAHRYRNERERRAACLRAVVNDAAARAHMVLVLEQDDSLLSWDNQHLIEFTRAAGCRDTLRYEHRRATDEHLLAIPDAIAWCWARAATGAAESDQSSSTYTGLASALDKREARAPRSSGRVSDTPRRRGSNVSVIPLRRLRSHLRLRAAQLDHPEPHLRVRPRLLTHRDSQLQLHGTEFTTQLLSLDPPKNVVC